MKVFMGIDQSFTSTGIVILNNNSEILHVTIISSEKNVDFFERAYIISQEINKLIIEHNVTDITLEGLAFGGVGNATRQLSGLQYTIVIGIRKTLSKEIGIIPPTTLKKFATGKGAASKVDMYNSTPEEVKTYFSTQNIKKTKGLYDCVDAYWLARYSITQEDKESNENTKEI